MAPVQPQTAIVQSRNATSPGSLPLIASTEPVPTLPSPLHVLVRVRAVALNPNDHKMVAHFPISGNGAGCDFCGIVESVGDERDTGTADDAQTSTPVPAYHPHKPGTRVCGTVFPYPPAEEKENHHRLGAFAQYVVVDSRLLLRVPDHWTDLQGAALGGVGWSTVALAMSSLDALALPGLPSKPAEKNIPVLVYGGGTATGTMACQLLKLSGYTPIAVTHSSTSAALAKQYGATAIAHYTNTKNCLEEIRAASAGTLLRHTLDCITDPDSASLCFAAIARTGGRYACLEEFRNTWRTRRVVKVKEVMGYEVLERRVDLGPPGSVYTRGVNEAAAELGRSWAGEMQNLLDRGLVEAHPVQEVVGRGEEGMWADNVMAGLEELRTGGVRGRKLVVRISE
ncbi:MAG: hypothetical protein M1820_007754 [Bogoriella megaspora]|nr:MAG: hypothetical protein M1820_007754 [Bogoriella megaspora]